LLDWGRANLDGGIGVDDLAQRERLRLAQRLLERTDGPVGVVLRRAGYESAVTMRAQLASRLRTSPRAYRQTFRA
jgi:transcriptional regulator GlxA family with amidase domain